MLNEQTNAAAGVMVAKMDAEIKAVLDDRCPGWTMLDVKERCHIIRVGDVETLYLDHVPVLEMHPIEFKQERTETGWTMRLTRNFRRLSVQSTGANDAPR